MIYLAYSYFHLARLKNSIRDSLLCPKQTKTNEQRKAPKGKKVKQQQKTKPKTPQQKPQKTKKNPNSREMNKNNTFIRSTQIISIQIITGKELLSQGYVYYPGIEANI